MVALQMSGARTTFADVAVLLVESAIVVSPSQAIESLGRLACAPESSCVLPFLPDEWAWICAQLNGAFAGKRIKVVLHRARWQHSSQQAWVLTGASDTGPSTVASRVKRLLE